MTGAYLGAPRRRRPVESCAAASVDGDAAVLALLARREVREDDAGEPPLSAVAALLDRRAAREMQGGSETEDFGAADLLARRAARAVAEPAPDMDSSDSSVARLLARRHTEV